MRPDHKNSNQPDCARQIDGSRTQSTCTMEGEEHMTDRELIEIAIQGHASTRDAIRYAIQQEREACAKLCEMIADNAVMPTANECAKAIRRRQSR